MFRSLRPLSIQLRWNLLTLLIGTIISLAAWAADPTPIAGPGSGGYELPVNK